ncbi:MAG: capsule biosynthesis protein CapB [Xanthomonadales bacterium]|nr:capsule biosynthesis protein CapB [Xanthomonadales bacterium]
MRSIGDGSLRVLVTGSRGKSSVARLLHAAFEACGLETWTRITGVVPRQLGPGGTREILRTSGAHVEEMRWWLRSLPQKAQAIVLENSSITPELQPLAARWLRPHLTILTNVLPDHQEAWGPGPAAAAEALAAGLHPDGRVLMPEHLEHDKSLRSLLEKRGCTAVFATAEDSGGPAHQSVNAGLALAALEHLGLPAGEARRAVQGLGQDRYDFRVLRHRGAELALAFSVNDIASTRALFRSLRWREESTRLVYNHRADRPGRFRSFGDWLSRGRWREVVIIGDRPVSRPAGSHYLRLDGASSLLRLLQPGDSAFGCGNIAGHPLALY